MKILFVIRCLGVGGAEQQLVTLAKGLRDAGEDVAVAVFYPGGEFEPDLRAVGIPVHSLGKRGRWDVSFVRRFLEVVRRFEPDVVHSYLGTSNKLVAGTRALLRGAGVVWGVRSAFMDLSQYDWLARASYRVEPRLSSLADAIIVNSRSGEAHAASHGFSRSRLVVVHNGIDCDRFRRDEASGSTWRARWGARPEDLVMGIVGRLDPMKDHPTFLRAAGAVAARAPRALFACVGSGADAYRGELRGLAEGLGLRDRMRWEPATRDIRGIYSALDVLVLSSRGESFPNVLAEAMACAVPCVATDVGDAAEIVGETGVVVPASNLAALTDGLDQALAWTSVERGKRARDARARIVARFSVPALVRNTTAVLERVALDRRRRLT